MTGRKKIITLTLTCAVLVLPAGFVIASAATFDNRSIDDLQATIIMFIPSLVVIGIGTIAAVINRQKTRG